MKQIFIDKADEIIKSILKSKTRCEPGALPWLFWGDKISDHSFYIKVGRNFEKWFKFIVENSTGFILLPDGITKDVSKGKNKDIDLIMLDTINKIVYFFELKSNLMLDTDKLPATTGNVNTVQTYLTKTYPDYKLECGILHWSVYDRNILGKKYLTKLKYAENDGVIVKYPKDLFKILNQDISETDYHNLFRNITKNHLLEIVNNL